MPFVFTVLYFASFFTRAFQLRIGTAAAAQLPPNRCHREFEFYRVMRIFSHSYTIYIEVCNSLSIYLHVMWVAVSTHITHPIPWCRFCLHAAKLTIFYLFDNITYEYKHIEHGEKNKIERTVERHEVCNGFATICQRTRSIYLTG